MRNLICKLKLKVVNFILGLWVYRKGVELRNKYLSVRLLIISFQIWLLSKANHYILLSFNWYSLPEWILFLLANVVIFSNFFFFFFRTLVEEELVFNTYLLTKFFLLIYAADDPTIKANIRLILKNCVSILNYYRIKLLYYYCGFLLTMLIPFTLAQWFLFFFSP